MKKLITNQYFIAAAIVGFGVGVWYVSTWRNKSWLAEQIVAKGGIENNEAGWAALDAKSGPELRKQLKALK